jgi:hypothetical protein
MSEELPQSNIWSWQWGFPMEATAEFSQRRSSHFFFFFWFGRVDTNEWTWWCTDSVFVVHRFSNARATNKSCMGYAMLRKRLEIESQLSIDRAILWYRG